MPRLRLRLLGPFEAWVDGRQVEITLKKARLLLAYLALAPTRMTSRDRIIGLLWSDRSEAQARQSLRQTLSGIRRVFGEAHTGILQFDGESLGFVQGAVERDATALLGVSAESATAELEEAVAVFRGDLLEGLNVRDPIAQDWLSDRRGEIRAVLLRWNTLLLAAYRSQQRYDDLERVASQMISFDPLCEEAHRTIIEVHLARADRAQAVQQYRRLRDLLSRELGVEPATETKALIAASESPAPANRIAVSRRPRSELLIPFENPAERQHNLPRYATALVGREAELEEVQARLRRYGIVTLTGSGGAGKTRMAIEVGWKLVSARRNGVWLVELASIEDPKLVADAVCGALGIPVQTKRAAIENATTYLNQKELLLILDNCEHVVDSAANVAEALHRACPSISILATSRETLSIPGESTYRVPSLAFPVQNYTVDAACALAYSAVELFVERASALVNGFKLTDANAPAVASICKQVDGIPLAIELAIPHLKMMRPEWLEKNLHDSFRRVRRAGRTTLSRHQTLWAMLDWSYRLLSEEEQAFLRRLSVFSGGCTSSSACWVASGEPIVSNDTFALLSSLVEKSLLIPDLSGDEPRYRFLETTRQYAFEQLRASGERGRRRRLSEYLADLFAKATETWPTTSTINWLARFEPELDNLRAALEWAFGPDGDEGLGVELAGHSMRIWDELSLLRERARWSEMAILRVNDSTAPAIAARLYLGQTAISAHGDQSGFGAAKKAVELSGLVEDPLGLGEALHRAGAALLTVATVDEALPYLDRALAVLEPLGPTKHLAACLRSKSVAGYFKGNLAGARLLLAQSAAIARGVGDARGIANAQIALAELEFSAGEINDAIAVVQRMLAGTNHNLRQSTLGHGNLAAYLLSIDRIEEARRSACESLRLAKSLGWPAAVVRAAEHLALVSALTGQVEVAAEILGYTRAFYGSGTASREFTEEATYNRLMVELGRQFTRERLDKLMAEGAGWSEETLAEAALAASKDAASS